MPNSKFTLPNTVYSPDQLQFCSEELHELAQKILSEKRGSKSKGELTLSQASLDLIATLPASEHGQPAALDKLADNLAELIQKAPVVHITLPALAGHKLREELVKWFRKECTPEALVVFQVNPDIAGGMVVRTTNQVHDFSFRHVLAADPKRLMKAVENVR